MSNIHSRLSLVFAHTSFSLPVDTCVCVHTININRLSKELITKQNGETQHVEFANKTRFVSLFQLYEINDDPKRKEFLDDLFSFMQRRGKFPPPPLIRGSALNQGRVVVTRLHIRWIEIANRTQSNYGAIKTEAGIRLQQQPRRSHCSSIEMKGAHTSSHGHKID